MFKKSAKSTLSNEEALSYILKEAEKYLTDTEVIPLTSAYNRILANDVISDIDIPGADTSSRDGFCLNASSIAGCASGSAVTLKVKKSEIHAGHVVNSIKNDECVYIATGGVLPEGADAVVQSEDVDLNKDKTEITIKIPVKTGDFVRKKASEGKIGDVAAEKFSMIEPELAGKIVSAGTFMVKVFKRPVVAILTSGDEIVMPWEKPEPWQVRTSNPTVMAMLVEKYGGNCLDFGIAKDTGSNMLELFKQAVQSADVVVTSGGIAMGRHDPVRNMFEKLCIESAFQKYGSHFRPVFFSEYQGKPIFALPGTPSGMYRIFEKFIGPFLQAIGGAKHSLG